MPPLKTMRLRRLAALTPTCDCAIDVGTDHGLLPIALVEQRTVTRAIASDALPEPLSMARRHVRGRGLEDRIDLRLGDGLTTLTHPGEAQVAIIAGMGVKSILAILEASCPRLLGIETLILQTPQVDNTLRAELTGRGLRVTHEEILLEAGKLYHTLLIDVSKSSTEQQEVGDARSDETRDATPSMLDELISPYLREKQDEETLGALADNLIHRRALRIAGLERAGEEVAEELARTIAELRTLEAFREAMIEAQH